VVKKTSEEIRNWKTEATKNMRKKDDRFIPSLMRKRFTLRPTPMDHALGLKKVFSYKIQKMGVGTLTRLPPMDLHLASGGIVHIPLRSRSLWHHLSKSPSLHARGLAVASFSQHSKARADEFYDGTERRGKRAKPRFTQTVK